MSGGCEVLIRLYTMAQRNGGALQHQSIFSVMLYENSDIECLYMMWGVFFQAIRSKQASSVTAGTEWKIILGPYLHSLSLLFLLSVWARSLVCDWFISPENGAAPSSQIHFIARAHSFFFFFLRNQLFIFLNPALIHILPFTDLPRPGWP